MSRISERPKPARRRNPAIAWSAGGLIVLMLSNVVGCVALNIPSKRQFDPADRGGVFGPWTHGGSTQPESYGAECNAAGCNAAGCNAAGHNVAGDGFVITGDGSSPATMGDGVCLDGGPLGEDPHFEMDNAPPPESVPWPRFHPVPTRPLLSGKPGHLAY